MTVRPPTIAIVGAGFSGSLLAVHLLRHLPPGGRIHLIERDQRFGRGVAYSTGNAGHLLNVRAGNMSAYADRPGHFVEWLQALPEAQRAAFGASADAGCFASRQLYGDYVQGLIAQSLRDPEAAGRLNLVADSVVAVEPGAEDVAITLGVGKRLAVDMAVLAVGNFPPAPPFAADPAFYDSALYQGDPWAPSALADLAPTVPVLLIGTGLTMVDTVLSLRDRGHVGPIHAVSRRGLLPHAHAAAPPLPPYALDALPVPVAALLRHLRAEARRAEAAGGDWRSVVDALRPATQDLWRRLPLAERRRFLRHLRPWWDTHRHRLAPQVGARIAAAQAEGQLRILAARVQGYRYGGHGVLVDVRPRGAAAAQTLSVARVVNCSGPACDYRRVADPLIRQLLDSGTIVPDALELGIEVSDDGAVIDRAGREGRRLYAIGPVTRSAFWEITAVPDIRRQAERLAAHLAERCAGLPG